MICLQLKAGEVIAKDPNDAGVIANAAHLATKARALGATIELLDAVKDNDDGSLPLDYLSVKI